MSSNVTVLLFQTETFISRRPSIKGRTNFSLKVGFFPPSVHVLVLNLLLAYSRHTYGSCLEIHSVSFNLLHPTTVMSRTCPWIPPVAIKLNNAQFRSFYRAEMHPTDLEITMCESRIDCIQTHKYEGDKTSNNTNQKFLFKPFFFSFWPEWLLHLTSVMSL